jgi:ubiquitin carboxyl-terminal hydrolase
VPNKSLDLPLTPDAENNPEVMSSLVHKLGLSKALSFHDVFSINDPDLLAFVPRPASALLLVFPVSRSYETFRMQEDEKKAEYEGKGAEEPVLWYKQTIRNACGLIGLLHAVSNGNSRDFIGMRLLQEVTVTLLMREQSLDLILKSWSRMLFLLDLSSVPTLYTIRRLWSVHIRVLLIKGKALRPVRRITLIYIMSAS